MNIAKAVPKQLERLTEVPQFFLSSLISSSVLPSLRTPVFVSLSP